jgi:glutamine cyclotransferase
LFTEGFLFHDNKLFESTGAPGNLPQTKSSFGILNLNTGKLDQKAELDRNVYFGEGILILNNYLYQLTYTNQVCFVYDAKTFQRKGQFNYRNKEGWGMTTDGKQIIMSDGSNLLTYINPSDFSVIKTISVSENGFALDFVNELEYIKGYIYANVWMTNFIVKIDPTNGNVVGKLDLGDLYADAKSANLNLAEMNGIAWDSISDKILVTGKLWPHVYEIKFEH